MEASGNFNPIQPEPLWHRAPAMNNWHLFLWSCHSRRKSSAAREARLGGGDWCAQLLFNDLFCRWERSCRIIPSSPLSAHCAHGVTESEPRRSWWAHVSTWLHSIMKLVIRDYIRWIFLCTKHNSFGHMLRSKLILNPCLSESRLNCLWGFCWNLQ